MLLFIKRIFQFKMKVRLQKSQVLQAQAIKTLVDFLYFLNLRTKNIPFGWASEANDFVSLKDNGKNENDMSSTA